jgi:hypothetical protein
VRKRWESREKSTKRKYEKRRKRKEEKKLNKNLINSPKNALHQQKNSSTTEASKAERGERKKETKGNAF